MSFNLKHSITIFQHGKHMTLWMPLISADLRAVLIKAPSPPPPYLPEHICKHTWSLAEHLLWCGKIRSNLTMFQEWENVVYINHLPQWKTQQMSTSKGWLFPQHILYVFKRNGCVWIRVFFIFMSHFAIFQNYILVHIVVGNHWSSVLYLVSTQPEWVGRLVLSAAQRSIDMT